MKIVNRKIKDLIGAEYNPRELTKDQYKQLKDSLLRFGVVDPVIVNKHPERDNIIIGGHQRSKVWEDMGNDKIPTVELSLTLEKEKELNVRLNKNTGQFDMDMLANNFDTEDLIEWGFSEGELVGFDEVDLEAEEDDYEMPNEIKTDIVLGDLIEIGEHRLLCGDGTDSEQVAKLMNGEKADMVFTDPPYRYKKMGDGGAFHEGHKKLKEDIKDIVDFDPTNFLNTLPLVFNKGINAYVFCNTDLVPDYCIWAKENKYNFNILTWHKKSFIPASNNHHFPDTEYLIYISKSAIFNSGLDVNYGKYFILDNEKSDDHPTIKPIELIANEIKISSNKNSLVFDFFLGSGTTMVAAHQLKRKCYGMELDPKYCQVIVDRMMKLDDKLVVKLNGKPYEKELVSL